MKKILLLLSLGALVLVSCGLNGKLTSITATPIKKGYWVGESVTAKDIAVTATYKKDATLSVSEFTISHEPFTAAGNVAAQALITETKVDNSPAASNPYENPTRWNNGNNTRCCENTFDKIFLLSQKEVTNPDFLFPGAGVKEDEAKKRQRHQTDFALANGGYYVDHLRCHVLLRTPVWNKYINPHYIRHAGETEYEKYTTTDGAFGIVPALCIDYKF